MALLVGEGDYLCLDARAIARTDTPDLAVVEGRAVEVVAEYAMHFRIGVYYIAAALRKLAAR